VSISGTGSGAWRYAFGGSVTPEQAAAGSVSLELDWNPDWGAPTSDLYDIGMGAVQLVLELAAGTEAPLYRVTAGLGKNPGMPGLHAKLTPQKELGALGSLITIGDLGVAYSPRVVLVPNQPPDFTLGQSEA
jgi:hypothetical protein